MEKFYLVLFTDHGQEIVCEGDFETVADALDNVWPEACICVPEEVSNHAIEAWKEVRL